jgi:hypothetical protein
MTGIDALIEQTETEKLCEEINQMESKNFKLVDSKEGFNVLSTCRKSELEMKENKMKNIIEKVSEQVLSMSRSTASPMMISLHVGTFVLLILNDLTDEFSFNKGNKGDFETRYDEQRTLAFIFKMVVAAFVVLSVILHVNHFRYNKEDVENTITRDQANIVNSLEASGNGSQYKMKANVVKGSATERDAIIDFA